MSRRKLLAGAGGLAVAAGTAGALIASGSSAEDATARAKAPVTAAVLRGDLSATVSLPGTLTYRARPDGSPYVVVNRARGTYTALPGVGHRVGCGEVLYRVDERPVLLLCGTVPAFRRMNLGDLGRDVGQLNRFLRLGGNAFTWRTAAAVRALQRRRGAAETGALGIGDAVFLPEPGRIARVTGRLGVLARPGTPVAQLTSGTLVVQVSLQASQQGEVRTGDRAQITLPGNRSARGRVTRLGRIAVAAGKDDGVASATIPASIRLDRPAKARGLDRAPVQVAITTRGVRDVLSVPATALVGRAGGGFAVEVVRPGGRRQLVAVRLGLFDSTTGRVAITGDIAAGARVVVPSL